MATAPVFSRPPAPPQEVQAQQGGPNPALLQRVAAALAAHSQGGAPSGAAPVPPSASPAGMIPGGLNAANPQGAILATSQQIDQLLQKMAQMKPDFGPWAERIQSLMKAGMGDVLQSPAPGAAAEPSSLDAPGGSTIATGTAKAPQGPLNTGFAG